MMSARSSSVTGTRNVESDSAVASGQELPRASKVICSEGIDSERAASSEARSVDEVRAAVGSAWPRTVANSLVESRVFVGTATAAAL